MINWDITTWTMAQWIINCGVGMLFLGFFAYILSDAILAGMGKKEKCHIITLIILWLLFTIVWYYGIGALLKWIFV